MLSGGVPAVVGDRLQTVYAFAKKRLDAFVQEPRFLSLGAPRETSVLKGFDRSIPDVYFNLRLAEARALLSLDDRSNLERASKIRACCAEIIESSLSPVSCRVWAFYLLGLLELDSARRTGELAALWQDTDQEAAVIGTDVEKARGLFKCCLPFLGPASELLNRNVLRCLALATGPEQTEKIIQMSACALIHTSIGSTARQHVSMHLSGDEGRDDEDLVSDSTPGARDINQIEEVFKILDYPVDATDHASSVDMLFEEIGKRVPSDWRFVAIALCPSGELLLNSLEKSESGDSLVSRTVCIFPDSTADARRPVHIYDDIMKPLDNIIQRSQDQLEGVNLEQADIVSNDVSQKREWWNNRESLDIELRNLIERVEHSIFGSERARLVLLGSSGSFEDDAFEAEGASNLMCGNLASKFEAATFSDSSVRQFGEIEPSDMKVAELRDELVERGITVKVLRKKRKAELVASLIEQRRQDSVSAARSPPRKYQSPDEDPRQAGCTFLILDENTHRFPFEGMPSLQGKCISRLPSLPFALATLSETASTQSSKVDDGLVVDPDRVSYILDPESNLGATQKRIQSFIESLTTRHKWSWRGVVGIEPTSKFVEESVTPVGGLLFFCGHGGGQSYFSRSRIDGLISSRASEVQRRCRSSIVLMGCSSGRLMSENRKHTKSSEQLPINFEPEGIALSYLCAGAPCVVGNLWDVTDRDIDRFSLSMLENFFGAEGNPSLPLCIAKARPSCRMKYLVGYAPVCYGVPVHLLPT
jgi:separase